MKALELRNVTKRFGAVEANKHVSLTVEAGTVHAVVGENGAGKSTLMHVAYGHARCDEGRIFLKGEEVSPARHSPAESIRRGVGMVHQHFMLIGPMTVAENVALGREPRRGLRLDLETAADELRQLAAKFGFDVDPDARIEDLSVGEQQRVEILKVLWRGVDVLILDEPTAVLTPAEVRDLFGVLRKLVADGMTVVLITHKLDEVVEIADRVTVMRRGEVVAELTGTLDVGAIATAMIGRPVLMQVDKRPASPGAAVLSLQRLRVRGRRGAAAVRDVSFEIRAGEVVAIAGVVGNGQSELVEAITGVRPIVGGTVALRGVDVSRAPVDRRHRGGLSHIPEDRQARGLVLEFSVAENLILGRAREHGTPFGLDLASVGANAETAIREFDIRPADADAPARALSGGNQQKVVVARELTRPGMTLLVCGQPTRGVDIGAIEMIHERLIAARDAGAAVLLVSAELSEIRALADRVLVMYRGKIVDQLDASQLALDSALERMGRGMLGVTA